MEKATRFPPNERLKALRKKRCWTQAQLAEEIGTTPKNVGRWELGKTAPSLYYCQKLSDVFHMSPGELGLMREDAILLPLPGADTELARDTVPQTTSINEEAPVHDRPQTGFSAIHTSTADSVKQESDIPATSRSNPHPWRVVLAILVLLVVIAGSIGLSKYFTTAHVTIRPGGSWISPMNGQMIHDVIHFAAFAYPTNPGDPTIDHVNFTVWWQGVDPRTWIIACAPHIPATKDIYKCDVSLARLHAPAGQIKISFDVYDQNGDSNLAPNGEHIITYSPSSLA